MAEDNELPDEYADTLFGEGFPADDFRDWIENDAPDEIREDFEAGLERGFSVEWSAALVNADIDPENVEHVGIMRDDSGWTVTVDGQVVAEFEDDAAASDYIWADLYWHMVEAGVDFDKEINSVGGD